MSQEEDQRIYELHGAIFACLADGYNEESLATAGKLCCELPEPSPLTCNLVQHALMECGFRLETAQDLALASRFYERLAGAPWADPAHRSNAQYRLAIVRLELGDIEGSRKVCQAAAAPGSDPHIRGMARVFLVYLLKRENRWKEAAAEADVVLADVPAGISRLDILLQRTTCLARAGSLDAATSGLELPAPGSSIPPMTARLWMEAAFGLEESGDLAVAGALYDGLLAQEGLPDEVRVNASFRNGLVRELRMDWEVSRRLYEAAIGGPPCFLGAQREARKRLAELLLTMEEHSLAAAHFAALSAMEELPRAERAGFHLQRAKCLWNKGAGDEALSELTACSELCPGSEAEVKAEVLRAEIYLQKGDRRAAAECCRRVAEHPSAEPLTRTAALAYVTQFPPRNASQRER
jgi:tetratricopeptide (TPR) repeat protein